MFQARSINRSPGDRYRLKMAARLSWVTRSRLKRTPCSVQGRTTSPKSSKSRIVTCRGVTWMVFNRIGSVQRATAPKPRNRTFPRNLIILECGGLPPLFIMRKVFYSATIPGTSLGGGLPRESGGKPSHSKGKKLESTILAAGGWDVKCGSAHRFLLE